MARLPRERVVRICLLSAHPMVLSELERVLLDSPFRLETRQMTSVMAEHGKSAHLPKASVYVIDGESPTANITDLISAVVGRQPKARLIVVAGKFTEQNAFPLLRLGVKGLLRYDQVAEQLERALRAVAFGGFWVPRTLLSEFVDAILKGPGHLKMAKSPRISRREREIVDGLLANLSNKELANNLNISERTVKFHVSNLLQKFGVGRRADLILLSFQGAVPGLRGSAGKSSPPNADPAQAS